MANEYVHGYSAEESVRLVAQATTLAELLHADTRYTTGSLVLEAGCGVGAQTVSLAGNSPGAKVVSLDISQDSLLQARQRIWDLGHDGVVFLRGDVHKLPFAPALFDHVFVCFVLEHLAQPEQALERLRRVLKPGGTITVIEGDHGSAYFYPDSTAARRAIACLVELQRRAGGDALIGRRLYPLLLRAGFRRVRVSPRMVYADGSRPALVDGFTLKTFPAMVEGVGAEAVGQGLMTEDEWAAGIRDLYRTAEPDGTLCYTFFKAVAVA
mgnify:CR=1 FL=1